MENVQTIKMTAMFARINSSLTTIHEIDMEEELELMEFRARAKERAMFVRLIAAIELPTLRDEDILEDDDSEYAYECDRPTIPYAARETVPFLFTEEFEAELLAA